MSFNLNSTFGFGSSGSGGGGGLSSANNGLSVNGSTVVFGQDYDDVGNIAALLNNREIPLQGYQVFFTTDNGQPNKSYVGISESQLKINGDSVFGEIPKIFFTDNAIADTTLFQQQAVGFSIVKNGQLEMLFTPANEVKLFYDNLPANDNTIFQVGGSVSVFLAPAGTPTTTPFKALNATAQGNYDTTSTIIEVYAGYFDSNNTRASGANNLVNIGAYFNAQNGQQNLSAIFDNGNVLMGLGTNGAGNEKLQIKGTARIQDNTNNSYFRFLPASGPQAIVHGGDPIISFEETVSGSNNTGTVGIYGSQASQPGNFFGLTLTTAGGIFNYSFNQFGWYISSGDAEGQNSGLGFLEFGLGPAAGFSNILYCNLDRDADVNFINFQNINSGTDAAASIAIQNDNAGQLILSVNGSAHGDPVGSVLINGRSQKGFIIGNDAGGTGFIGFCPSGISEANGSGFLYANRWFLIDGSFAIPTDDTGDKLQVHGGAYIKDGLKNWAALDAESFNLVETDSGRYLSNVTDGGSGIDWYLPAATPGLIYRFTQVKAGQLIVHANTGDVIYVGSSATTSGGQAACVNIGTSLELVCFEAGTWVNTAGALLPNWILT